MQLTARTHRSDPDVSTPTSRDNRQSLTSPSVDTSKSFRRQLAARHDRSHSRSGSMLTTLIMFFRRQHFHWALLSSSSKVTTILVLFFLCQYVLLGVCDVAFGSIGDNQAPTTSSLSLETQFAVVINTYRRPDRLRQAVQHYADTCGRRYGVGQIFIIWAEQNTELPTPESFFTSSGTIRAASTSSGQISELFSQSTNPNRSMIYVLQKGKDSLNSRFEPIPQLETTAVFMVDDDLRVDCRALYQGFSAWKVHPDSMVGYYPRLASSPRQQGAASKTSAELVYHTWPVVYYQHAFNFVLTKASFLHSKYLELYTNDEILPKAVKDHVDQHMNCEDIAMSLLVANYTKTTLGIPAPPIYVEGSVSDQGLFGGISSGSGHMTTRSDCLTTLTAIFEAHGWASPLDYQVPLDGPNVWTHHAPGMWWQSRPSNLFEWLALANTFT